MAGFIYVIAKHRPEGTPYKSDDAMFLPLAKAMHLRRDVCLWHVADFP